AGRETVMETAEEVNVSKRADVAAKGEAAIKPEFLTTKDKFHGLLDSEWQGSKREKASESDAVDGSKETSLEEPEPKRLKQNFEGRPDGKRLRGQNKSRPHTNSDSAFKKCFFDHDIVKYMDSKPSDIGETCHIYETFGKCAYGLSCRFAKAHTTPDFKSMEKADLVKVYEGRTMVKNNMSKELQGRLRKRSVSFEKSEKYLKTLSDNKDKGAQQGNGKTSEKAFIKNAAITNFCGNLPFRRVCKRFGADITCGEMAMCTNLLQGHQSEWALLRRHESEDVFGIQVEGSFPDTMTRCAELINNNTEVDFVDINSGCPIDLVYNKGGGCGLMTRTRKFERIVKGMNYVLDVPLTVKIRTGVQEKSNIAHKLIPEMKNWGVSMITLHGRSREQRYTKLADWDYITTCAKLASPIPLFGNGDILSYEDAMKAKETGVSGIMIARGALIKPWIFTEIKESRHWDISSSERLDILKDFSNFGLEHWGSDTRGVERTRTFLLEWLSFLCRYIPVGLLERVPQKINERPPYYMGRNYLETLMASQNVEDWIRISEMLLGPVPKNFEFLPKHKANSYK
uniref:tRNA-dihydrouridine(47) synthase [NAD(P)(+)] n=1 Tax=Neolamprologus brichardi TaxID=32507 RepID=A0A3Q4HCH3_NEOBR